VTALAAALSAAPAGQQTAVATRMSARPDLLTRIVTGRLSPRFPPAPAWFGDGSRYLVIEPRADRRGSDVVSYDTATGGDREVLITAEQLTAAGSSIPLEIDDLAWSPDRSRVLVFTNTRRVWRTNARGDYWVLDRRAGTLKQLGGGAPEASLMYAAFSPDASRVAYVRDHDIYVEDPASGAITRVTTDGSELVINGIADWVNEEELDLHDCFRWSPDGRRIAFWQFDLHGVGNYPLQYDLGRPREIVTSIPYPQTGPYPVTLSVPYPLAGTTNSAVRAGIVDAGGGDVTWLRLDGDPREHYIARLQWVDPATVLLQRLNRLQNTDEFLLGDASTGAVRRMWRDTDEAFISIGYNGLPEARPIDHGRAFLVQSEKDGWQHVYRITREGRETLVTRGAMDVVSVEGVDEQAGILYFIASPDNATERYLYRAPLDGSAAPVRVTPASSVGSNTYDIAPGARYAFHAFSSFDDPGLRELVTLPEHRTVRPMGSGAEAPAEMKNLIDPPVEFFRADAGRGVQVDGYVIKPPDFDPAKKYPILVHIYGEPASQTVLNAWGGNGALFHRYIASLGYLVASFDNAGTPAPRGRAWRKSIYGAVGVLSSEQQANALRSLAANRSYIDLDRVGVWGWSGGGTNTLNLMFRSPDLYKVGMAVAPVPDQRLYDSIYQERYMGLPQQNADGYRAASAINLADRLKGNLLIVHGSGDDNVHYQGTELLVNRLIELGKPFDFMTYPGRTHSISEGPGTTAHVYQLLTRYLTEHLPAGPR
jgi:dipeptidyl-peptidase-4